MKNAHQRFGVLEYTKRMKDTTTRVRLRLDHFVGEMEKEATGKAHVISVLGGDSDVGAIWAAINERSSFTVEGPGINPFNATLGEGAQCFRGSITIAGRKPIRHLVAISADLAKTRPGADPEGRRTVLCDDDATFVFYRVAHRFGLPVVPEWADRFMEELNHQRAIQPLVGLGCSPVLVTGTKKMFLKWIGRALRRKLIRFPEASGPVPWSVAHTFFGVGESEADEESAQQSDSEKTATREALGRGHEDCAKGFQ